MKTLAIIPARYGSSRFPGKPLARIGDMTMVQHVYSRVMEAGVTQAVVATDDRRILDHVVSFGGRALLTAGDHVTGTDRCAEALDMTGGTWDVVLNVQGDEPFLKPGQLQLLTAAFADPDVRIATLVRIAADDEYESPHAVKAVTGRNGDALYFSRSVIPYHAAGSGAGGPYYLHVGLYGFRPATLKEVAALPPGTLEKRESLEQLRWLEHGYRIRTVITPDRSWAVDTPEDLERVKSTFRL